MISVQQARWCRRATCAELNPRGEINRLGCEAAHIHSVIGKLLCDVAPGSSLRAYGAWRNRKWLRHTASYTEMSKGERASISIWSRSPKLLPSLLRLLSLTFSG